MYGKQSKGDHVSQAQGSWRVRNSATFHHHIHPTHLVAAKGFRTVNRAIAMCLGGDDLRVRISMRNVLVKDPELSLPQPRDCCYAPLFPEHGH